MADLTDVFETLDGEIELDIPKSSFFVQSSAKTKNAPVAKAKAATVKVQEEAEEGEVEVVHSKLARPPPPRQKVELVDAGSGWREVTVVDSEQDGIEDELVDVVAPVIEKPMDAMNIADHGKRERALKRLARKLYDQQPAFLDRGKKRFDGLVEVDSNNNRLLWNRKPIPNSKIWRSTFDHSKHTGDKRPHLGQSILVLMEKNESRIIERMLASMIDDIDGFIILDTGSTDGTQQIMWDFLVTKHKKRGAIYECPWYDFGTNRTITVQLAFGSGDWLLLMDADYRLERTDKQNPQSWKQFLPSLKNNPPAWLLLGTYTAVASGLSYARPHIVLGSVLWAYSCRTHEYLRPSAHDKSKANMNQITFSQLLIDHVGDGCSKADKVARDLIMLEMDRMDDPNDPRNFFYSANTATEIRMPDWGLRAYKEHAKRQTWNEELLCGAENALRCLSMLPNVPFERELQWVLHSMASASQRLEPITQWMARVHSNPKWWPRMSHLLGCLGAFMAQNEYPSNDKLFVKTEVHKFQFWFELSIVCYYTPVYFELGLFAINKLLTSDDYKYQPEHLRQQLLRNKALYDGRLNEWRQRGVRVTVAIRRYLLEQGLRSYSQGRFARAKEWYEKVLHPIVSAEVLPAEMVETGPEERKQVHEICNHINSKMYHQFNRLTAWKNCRPVSNIVTEVDHDRALASYMMGQCSVRTDPDNRIVNAMYYIDSLKFVPLFAPAISSLWESTICQGNYYTRCISYLIRLATMGPAATVAAHVLKNVKAAQEGLVADQSEWAHIVAMKSHPGTACLIPLHTASTKCDRNISSTHQKWENIMQTSFVC
jgi:hypothetical protein